MSRKILVRILLGAVIFQLLVLAGKYLLSVYPLWTGKPVILEIVPVDPRSLFRGNYVHLDYSIARLDDKVIPDELRFHKGSMAYVHLKEDRGVYRPSTVTATAPAEGIFIRGRVQGFHKNDNGAVVMRLTFGIEAYFAPKKRALEIEDTFRDRRGEDAMAYAQVRIAANGKAALEDIVWQIPDAGQLK